LVKSFRAADMTLGCIGYVASLRQVRHTLKLQDQPQGNHSPVDIAPCCCPRPCVTDDVLEIAQLRMTTTAIIYKKADQPFDRANVGAVDDRALTA
jgi:hypothetical protein